jgi:RNA polymerase sigma-70 factor, ECF subfamily
VPRILEQAAIMSEAEAIERALRRDPVGVEAITTRYNRRLFRMARSILRNDDDAEEALQTAYCKAFTSLSGFRGASSLGTWLTRIVINEALAMVRSRRTALAFEERKSHSGDGQVISFPSGASMDPERGMAQRQIKDAVEQAIDSLPDDYRTVLVARVLEEMSIEETAALLGIKPETVKTRLFRARRMLRADMERRIGPVVMNAFPFDGWRCRRMTQSVLARLGLGD